MGFAKTQKDRLTRVWARARGSWVGKSATACIRCGHELSAWVHSEQASPPHVKQLTESIAALHMGAPDSVDGERDTEAPIFLLSTYMRSGSTLLQRILVTDPRVLLWGEPFGEMDLVARIAEMVSHSISPWNLEWSEKLNPTSPSIATSWIADLYPSSENFRWALRGFFDRWLGEPARKLGFVRWGFKEVRLGATEAALLHWLYPRAKFVVITRNPYDCYRSLVDSGWPIVYHRRPEICIDSAAAFARQWNRLALSWSELPAGFPSFHIKYEDLTKSKVDFRGLESWLGLEIKENVALSVVVGGSTKRPRLNWYERLIIAREAAAGMRALGYSDHTEKQPERVNPKGVESRAGLGS
jgi:hypothetical protein